MTVVPLDQQTPEGLRSLLKAGSDRWQPLLKTIRAGAE